MTRIAGKKFRDAGTTYGGRIAMAKTQDFESFDRISFIFEPGNKGGVLFLDKINDKFARLDRPLGSNDRVSLSMLITLMLIPMNREKACHPSSHY